MGWLVADPFVLPLRDPPDEECRRCLARLADGVDEIDSSERFADTHYHLVSMDTMGRFYGAKRYMKDCPRDCWLAPERRPRG